jgi:multisubunit Na+/H+ antiporter MnhG subunit
VVVTIRDVVVDVLLVLAVSTALVSCLGVLAMGDVYQKAHFLSPVGVLSPILVALAVIVRAGWGQASLQTSLAVVLLAVGSPVIGHAALRAARIREQGDWRLLDQPPSGGGRR